MSRIGIIGGSGLYQIEGLTNIKTIHVTTPFGDPSDAYIIGKLEGREVVFLPRHARGHRLLPSEIPYRANIFGMKKLGVTHIISVSAVGSLREDYKPTDVVLIDNFFDRTNQSRSHSFFGDGIVAHVQMAHPVCEPLRHILIDAGKKSGANIKESGIYLNIEGPQFSTLAESYTYRKWGLDVIGMTQMSEARLAREAEICYVTMAMVTDYDCWHEAETVETVSANGILKVMQKNTETAKEIIKQALPQVPEEDTCDCKNALAVSFVTDKSLWPAETIEKLKPIIEKYLEHNDEI
ncbi:S-methyl-5'-thioadenosine phosphorylase [candidate division KSB1 bacterium]|nr:MAG: S-methyl-5'-thioadenosine phosphorylase [candidate division KSB1 bacterium]